jgi:hypothetical protein
MRLALRARSRSVEAGARQRQDCSCCVEAAVRRSHQGVRTGGRAIARLEPDLGVLSLLLLDETIGEVEVEVEVEDADGRDCCFSGNPAHEDKPFVTREDREAGDIRGHVPLRVAGPERLMM